MGPTVWMTYLQGRSYPRVSLTSPTSHPPSFWQAISISGPEGRMVRISTDEVIPLMQRLARELSTELNVSRSH